MGITVEALLDTPFATRNDDERLKILIDGPPKPNVTPKVKLDKNVSFAEELYKNYSWMTGSEKQQRFFCWPCLLFVDELSNWNSTGVYFTTIANMKEKVMEHKKSVNHLQGLLDMHLFIHRNTKVVDTLTVILQHNQMVKRNRDLMKRIIDTVYHMVSLRYPSIGKDTGDRNHLKISECIDFLNLLKNHDTPNIIDDAIELLRANPAVMTDVVKAMTNLMKTIIAKEIQQSTYVSVVLSEHSEIDSKSQISTILRYLKGGQVCEKFVGFTTLSEYKTVDVIYKHLNSVITEFGVAERFLSFAIDGSVISTSQHLVSLQDKVRAGYPYVLFSPCYFHQCHYILVQSLYRISECQLFFKTMNSMKTYIQTNPNVLDTFTQMTNGGTPDLGDEDWCNPEFLRLIKRRRRQLIQIFDSIMENCDEWRKEDVAVILGYQHILQDFQTVFLLEIFYKIFGYTSGLDKALKSNLPENVFGSNMADNATSHLTIERDLGFENVWVAVIGEWLGTEEPKPAGFETILEEESKLMWRELYLKIIDLILQEIISRYESVHGLEFFHILNYEKHGKFVISQDQITKLLRVQGPYFDELSIKNEMKVLCVNTDVFAEKNVHELHDIFLKKNLKTIFPSVFKLSELILTVPCKAPSLENNSSKFESIAQWSYIPGAVTIPGDASLLIVEKDMLEEMVKRIFYYDEVLVKFFEVNKSIDVMYR